MSDNNEKPRKARKVDGPRKIGDSNGDRVARELAKCPDHKSIIELGVALGIPKSEGEARLKSAQNFGLFRMTMGNRMRGELARAERGEAKKKVAKKRKAEKEAKGGPKRKAKAKAAPEAVPADA